MLSCVEAQLALASARLAEGQRLLSRDSDRLHRVREEKASLTEQLSRLREETASVQSRLARIDDTEAALEKRLAVAAREYALTQTVEGRVRRQLRRLQLRQPVLVSVWPAASRGSSSSTSSAVTLEQCGVGTLEEKDTGTRFDFDYVDVVSACAPENLLSAETRELALAEAVADVLDGYNYTVLCVGAGAESRTQQQLFGGAWLAGGRGGRATEGVHRGLRSSPYRSAKTQSDDDSPPPAPPTGSARLRVEKSGTAVPLSSSPGLSVGTDQSECAVSPAEAADCPALLPLFVTQLFDALEDDSGCVFSRYRVLCSAVSVAHERLTDLLAAARVCPHARSADLLSLPALERAGASAVPATAEPSRARAVCATQLTNAAEALAVVERCIQQAMDEQSGPATEPPLSSELLVVAFDVETYDTAGNYRRAVARFVCLPNSSRPSELSWSGACQQYWKDCVAVAARACLHAPAGSTAEGVEVQRQLGMLPSRDSAGSVLASLLAPTFPGGNSRALLVCCVDDTECGGSLSGGTDGRATAPSRAKELLRYASYYYACAGQTAAVPFTVPSGVLKSDQDLIALTVPCSSSSSSSASALDDDGDEA